eukprot:274917-Pleurochrysis_carterae.AAC.1
MDALSTSKLATWTTAAAKTAGLPCRHFTKYFQLSRYARTCRCRNLFAQRRWRVAWCLNAHEGPAQTASASRHGGLD